VHHLFHYLRMIADLLSLEEVQHNRTNFVAYAKNRMENEGMNMQHIAMDFAILGIRILYHSNVQTPKVLQAYTYLNNIFYKMFDRHAGDMTTTLEEAQQFIQGEFTLESLEKEVRSPALV